MKHWINLMTSSWVIAAGALALQAYLYFQTGLSKGEPWRFGVALVALASSMILFTRKSWAFKMGSGFLVSFALLGLIRNYSTGITGSTLIFVGGYTTLAWLLWTKPHEGWWSDDEPPIQKDDSDAPIVSLVQLRSSQRYLEPTVLAEALSQAWGLKIVPAGQEQDTSTSNGILGNEHAPFIVAIHAPIFAAFVVHSMESPYFEDSVELSTKISNLRAATVVEEHTAWLSIDFISASNPQLPLNTAYQMIGKAIAALADDDTVAIYHPETRQFNLWNERLEENLCGDTPLSVFDEEIKAPIIRVSDDLSIDEAIAEARLRWPEFVKTFQTRESDDVRYLVKAPFKGPDGDIEHMWLQVIGLEPDYIHGHLINEPFHCHHLKMGTQVEVEVNSISDWICPNAAGDMLGNFTQNVVNNAAGTT